MTLHIVGISEMRKCGLKYVIYSLAKEPNGLLAPSDCSDLILIKASSNGIVRCGLSLNHNLQPKEEAQ